MFLIARVPSREAEGCVFRRRAKKERMSGRVRGRAKEKEREREKVERQLFT